MYLCCGQLALKIKKTKQKTFHFHENTWGMTYLCNNQTH